MRMNAHLKLLDNHVQDKINDCLDNLREMQEIETQLQQSCGVDPHFTTLRAFHIDLWLQRWKRIRESDLEPYRYILGYVWRDFESVKVAYRLFCADCYSIIRRREGQPPPTPADANPSQLEALQDKHLQEEIDILEQYLCKIRGEHRLLVVQLRSKVV